MFRFAVLLAVTTACGRIAFDPRDDAGSATTGDAPGCPAGYTLDEGSCYRAGTGTASWIDAEAACEADAVGAHLIVIDSAAEALVADRYRAPQDIAWIGTADLAVEGSYRTVTNSAPGFLVFAMGQPDGVGQNCLTLGTDVELRDNDCTFPDDYICEYDGIPAVSLAWGVCPAGYTFLANGCFRSVSAGTGLAWLAAEAACEADGPGHHLVVLDSLAEAMAVDAFVDGSILDHWVGASDIVNEGVFVSVTNGALGFSTFQVGEPNNGTSQNCLAFDDAVELSSADCASDDDFVCEYDGIVAVPAAYGQ